MKKLFLFSLFGVLLACSSSDKKEAPAGPILSSSMQQLKHELDQLFPLLLESKKFYVAQNHQSISAQIKNLETISQNVSHSPAMQHQDPTLAFLSRGFQEDVRRAREAFEMGHKEYARTSLLGTTAYCIECHTRTNNGPSFQTTEVQQALATANPLERGEYLLATRQFEAAFSEFMKVINNATTSKPTVFDMDRAAKMALMISVRFQGKPDKAMQAVNDLMKASAAPFYLKTTAKSWKVSLEDWKREKTTQGDALKSSQELIKRAQEKSQGRDERAGDVDMMRAQALLHPLLSTESAPARLGEALFLMGQTYEAVKDFAMWSLHEDYYESCIRKAPHSSWSGQCYRRLEESILLGFTGSAGTSIPADIQEKLNELKILAH